MANALLFLEYRINRALNISSVDVIDSDNLTTTLVLD